MGAKQAGGGNCGGEGVAAGCRRGGGGSVLVNAAVVRAPAPDHLHPWGPISGRDTNSVLDPIPRNTDNVPTEDPTKSSGAEDPTKSSGGSVIVFGPRNTPDGTPVTAPNGGVIVYGPRDMILA
ncbi:hypothetical protein K438DRAFT_1992949 [Mycena galopus ATCC 62051]|nr:hypothetical protein K438DRAFT_1992949 [Mycena galopus ATCC 62051]